MATLEVTDEQIISLLTQLTPERQARVLNRFALAANVSAANGSAPVNLETERPRPRFGSGKQAIAYIADDFDAPLDDMKEYME